MSPRMLRTSERVTFKRCGYKWYWTYVARLHSRDTAPALLFGDYAHQALAAYYIPGKKRGPHPVETILALIKERGDFQMKSGDDEGRMMASEMGEEVMTNYVDLYRGDQAIEVIQPEFPALVRIRDRGGRLFYYVMRFDAVIKVGGRMALFEHKTTSDDDQKHLQMDEQGGSYWAFSAMVFKRLGMMELHDELDMILYNFLRKRKKDDRPEDSEGRKLNLDGKISKKQPPPLFKRVQVFRDADDRKIMRERVKDEAYIMELTRKGAIPLTKNPTRDCNWQCQFYNMCELHESGNDWKSYASAVYDVRDPYEDYKRDLGSGGGEHGSQENKTTRKKPPIHK